MPMEKAGKVESPFVVVFDSIGIPYAADLMNFVILTALLSVANSGLYAATRMLYSLSKEGMASPKLAKVNKRGIPMNALYITIGVALLSLLSGFKAEKTVFVWYAFACRTWSASGLDRYHCFTAGVQKKVYPQWRHGRGLEI